MPASSTAAAAHRGTAPGFFAASCRPAYRTPFSEFELAPIPSLRTSRTQFCECLQAFSLCLAACPPYPLANHLPLLASSGSL